MESYTIDSFIHMDITIHTIDSIFEKKCSSSWSYKQRSGRPHHGLVYSLDGNAIYYTEGRELPVKKNDILFLPKGSEYLILGDTHFPYHFIVVSFDLTEDDTFLSLPIQKVTHPTNYTFIKDTFHKLESIWFYKGIAHRIKCKALLQDILYTLIHFSIQEEIHTSNFPKIQAAVSYMETCYDKEIRVEELSTMVNMSESHFRRLFKDIYKISPVEYITTLRVNKAKDLILSEMYSISEVAEKVGYSNIYYFSRAFKKMTGECPTEFKRK